MSGLLGRLVGQAKDGDSPTRIRSAASVHARAPVAALQRDEPSLLELPASPRSTIPAPMKNEGEGRVVEAGAGTRSGTGAHESPRVLEDAVAESASQASPDTLRATHARADSSEPQSAIELPQRLLPVVQVIPAPAAAPVGIAALSAATRAAPERSSESRPVSTEVHVHIGRIEIAGARDTPVSRAPRARPATRSLSSYLSRGKTS